MRCNPFSQKASPAVRRYMRGIIVTMSVYVLAVLGTSYFVVHHHPRGWVLFAMAAPPSLCILAMLGVVVQYLRTETDEYQRMLAVRSLLCATFGTLAMGAYVDFLRGYGDLPALPPFTDFVVFWMIFAAAQGTQSLLSRTDES